MKATRNFPKLTLKPESMEDIKALDVIVAELDKKKLLSSPVEDVQEKKKAKSEKGK